MDIVLNRVLAYEGRVRAYSTPWDKMNTFFIRLSATEHDVNTMLSICPNDQCYYLANHCNVCIHALELGGDRAYGHVLCPGFSLF